MKKLFGFEIETDAAEIEKPKTIDYIWSNGKDSGMFQAWFSNMYFDHTSKARCNRETLDIVDYCGRTRYFSGTLLSYAHTL